MLSPPAPALPVSSPQEMEKEIKSVFRSGNQDEVLSEAFRLTITRKDIQTLNNLNWLNDEVGAEMGDGAGLGGNGTGSGGVAAERPPWRAGTGRKSHTGRGGTDPGPHQGQKPNKSEAEKPRS